MDASHLASFALVVCKILVVGASFVVWPAVRKMLIKIRDGEKEGENPPEEIFLTLYLVLLMIMLATSNIVI